MLQLELISEKIKESYVNKTIHIEDKDELFMSNENKKVILRHLKVIEDLNSNVCFEQLKILQKTQDDLNLFMSIASGGFVGLGFFMLIFTDPMKNAIWSCGLLMVAVILMLTNQYIQNHIKKEKKKNYWVAEIAISDIKNIVKDLRSIKFFDMKNKCIKKLKKELKNKNYWNNEENFKIEERERIQFNFKRLIKHLNKI